MKSFYNIQGEYINNHIENFSIFDEMQKRFANVNKMIVEQQQKQPTASVFDTIMKKQQTGELITQSSSQGMMQSSMQSSSQGIQALQTVDSTYTYDGSQRDLPPDSIFGNIITRLGNLPSQQMLPKNIPVARMPIAPTKPKEIKKKKINNLSAIPVRNTTAEKTQTIRVNLKPYTNIFTIRDCAGATFTKNDWVCVIIGIKLDGVQQPFGDPSQIEITMARTYVNDYGVWAVSVNKHLNKLTGYVDVMAIPVDLFSEISL